MTDSFKEDILKKPLYWAAIGFTVCLSFFFDLANRTLSVDDLSRPYYVGENKAMIASTRWGMQVWNDIFTSTEFVPFAEKFMGVIFLILGGCIFSRILYTYIKNSPYKLALCTLFSCLYISFPLINEIWSYNGANMIVTGNAMIAAAAVLLLYDQSKLFSLRTLLSAAMMTLVVSSYESGAFLYITVVISIILLDHIIFNRKNWIYKAIIYAIPLIISVVLRYLIGFTLIRILDLSYSPMGAIDIVWRAENFQDTLAALLNNTLQFYFFRSLIYLPISVFVLAFASGSLCILVIAFRKKSFTTLLLWLLLLLSLFFQSYLQGVVMPYRTAQTIHYFSAFSLMMVSFAVSCANKRLLTVAVLVFSGFICYRQSFFLNQVLALNNQRSDFEAAAIREVGFRLKTFYEEKPIMFVGYINLGENINRQKHPVQSNIGGYIYRKLAIRFNWRYEKTILYETNVNSLINWNYAAFGSQKMMAETFSYYGFDIEVFDPESWDAHLWQYYESIEKTGPFQPLEIRDVGDFLIVFFGS
ncbi:MAG: glucosyltransferase domain-containing protein [Flexilinea sp.]|nr:glucosyltransferase domain-containing protein [Flexilinea sp.]